MRAHSVVTSVGGLVPFGHLGWAYHDGAEFRVRTGEYVADGLAQSQWVEYVAEGSRESLAAELAAPAGTDRRYDGAALRANPVSEFYEFVPGSDVVDPERSVAKRVLRLLDVSNLRVEQPA